MNLDLESCTSMRLFLSATAMNGHQECLRLLLSRSQHVDVDAQDVNGQ